MKTVVRPETEMKESGLQWLGEIPNDWKVSRVGNFFSFSSGDSLTNEEIRDEGMYLVYGANGIRGYYSKYNLAEKRILLGRVGALAGNVHIVDGKVWVTEHALIASNKLDLVEEYYGYVFESMNLIQYSKSSAQPVISGDTLQKLRFPVPKLSEQQAIADYLDETCSKIDEIIAEAKASIDEYTTLKQALIAEITTSGLNKNIDFCETGFAWMGKIPTHWELKPFKYVLNERNEKNNPIKSTERLSLSIDKGITLYAEKTTNLDRFKDDFTAYKLAYKGDLVMNSMNMIVGASGVSDYFGCVSPVYYTYFDNEPDHITAKYCEYLFRSRMLMRVLRSLGRGIYHIDRGDDRVNTCRLKVSRDDLRALILPVPPLCEQRDIVSFLDKRTAEIDSLIAEKESLINDLEAYKKSLIYEVVTGKRRVV